MVRIAYHASHEQFAPSELLALAKRAEAAGFDAFHSSDHFHPWSERQGHSGLAWSWLGAALEGTRLPGGIISAPGYRYHTAIIAQGVATLAEMYPDRLWLALGSGQAINEAITGEAWPDKAERNARLAECAGIIRRLLSGETVTERGRVTVVEAKLYSRPAVSPPLLVAAVTAETAAMHGAWADGLLTVDAEPDQRRRVFEAFARNGGAAKPVKVKTAICWAANEAEAEAQALDQWAANALGGDVNWDIRRPADFDHATRHVRGEDIRRVVRVSADLGRHRAWLQELLAEGVDEIILHQVGRNQAEFIDAFGDHVLPGIRR